MLRSLISARGSSGDLGAGKRRCAILQKQTSFDPRDPSSLTDTALVYRLLRHYPEAEQTQIEDWHCCQKLPINSA